LVPLASDPELICSSGTTMSVGRMGKSHTFRSCSAIVHIADRVLGNHLACMLSLCRQPHPLGLTDCVQAKWERCGSGLLCWRTRSDRQLDWADHGRLHCSRAESCRTAADPALRLVPGVHQYPVALRLEQWRWQALAAVTRTFIVSLLYPCVTSSPAEG
jgi:hypothetical protein